MNTKSKSTDGVNALIAAKKEYWGLLAKQREQRHLALAKWDRVAEAQVRKARTLDQLIDLARKAPWDGRCLRARKLALSKINELRLTIEPEPVNIRSKPRNSEWIESRTRMAHEQCTSDAPVRASIITLLNLGTRIENCLDAEGIYCVDELTRRTEVELRRCPQIGFGSVDKIRAALHVHGLELSDGRRR
jgi:hypothetical protein